MSQFYIPEPITIPYFDHGNTLKETIKNSSRRRNMSPLAFSLKKVKNIILARLSYSCPFNGLRIRMNRWRGVHIGKNVYIGQYCVIDNAYPEYIFIEDNASLAGNDIVLAHTNPYQHFSDAFESGVSPVLLRNGCWVGVGSTILRGVTIGEKGVVSAGTVVDKDIPARSIAKGNPMKIIADLSAIID